MGTFCSINREYGSQDSGTIGARTKYCGVIFENISGDICDEVVDVIVSSANNRLAHNTGLANSIVIKGGAIIQEESDKIVEENDGVLPAGSAVITSGGKLKANYVVHVVSPVWTGGDKKECEKLGEAVITALDKAAEVRARSVAMPLLSSGLFGFPKHLATQIIIAKALEYVENMSESCTIRLIRFVNIEAETIKGFKLELEKALKGKDAVTKETTLRRPEIVKKLETYEEEKISDLKDNNFDLVFQQDSQEMGSDLFDTRNKDLETIDNLGEAEKYFRAEDIDGTREDKGTTQITVMEESGIVDLKD